MRKINAQRRPRLHQRAAFTAAAEIDGRCRSRNRFVGYCDLIVLDIVHAGLPVEEGVEELEDGGGVCAFELGERGHGGAGPGHEGVLLHAYAEEVAVLTV